MLSSEIKVGGRYASNRWRNEIVTVLEKHPKGVLTVERVRGSDQKVYHRTTNSYVIARAGEKYTELWMSRDLKCPVDAEGNPLPCKSMEQRRKKAARTALTKVQREEQLREASKYLGVLGVDSTTKYAQYKGGGRKKLLLMLDGTGAEELLEILKELAESRVKSLLQ